VIVVSSSSLETYVEDDQTRLARDRVGQTVRDRWHLDELLGIGGMAAVYAATHRNGKRVALKILHTEYAHIHEATHRFVEEGYLANRVRHPGVVSIIDDDKTEDGSAFLVMDLLEGETLEARISREGWLEPAELVRVMDELLDILAAAHASGIVHRDVKPTNIFLTRDGQVKLLDFGIARLNVPNRPRTTQFGSTVGTPAFMPPEQARGRLEEIDARTDLWAVGATMFMALTGRQVHEAETTNEELLAAMTTEAPSLRSIAPRLPASLVEVVDRALAYDRAARWPDAAAMREALHRVSEAFLAGEEGDAPPRSSFASCEQLSPRLVCHAPTLSTARGLALPKEVRSASIPGMRSPAATFRALAVGALALAIVAGGSLHWSRRQQARRAAAAITEPTSATSALEVERGRNQAASNTSNQEPNAEGSTQAASANPLHEAAQRSSDPVVSPAAGKKPARAISTASRVVSAPKMENAAPSASPAPAPATPSAADPLDRRR
jgi:serine/threonine-protein kinase